MDILTFDRRIGYTDASLMTDLPYSYNLMENIGRYIYKNLMMTNSFECECTDFLVLVIEMLRFLNCT